MTDRWTDRLSDYLDGDLPPGERLALEAHLSECATCRATVDELRHVVRRAHALVDKPVAADLWPGIASRIGASNPPVIDLAAARSRRQVSFSLPQLAAAAVLLLAAGAGAAAIALRPAAEPAVLAAGPAGQPTAIPVGLPGPAELSYDAAIRDLSRALEAERGRLSPRTVAVLDRNLARIDLAIAEARSALAADPANAYLSAHLANTMQQKLALLQQATVLADVAS